MKIASETGVIAESDVRIAPVRESHAWHSSVCEEVLVWFFHVRVVGMEFQEREIHFVA